ncbi:MAG: hypothetical protein R6W67_03890 [Bacteroidales bacterium]
MDNNQKTLRDSAAMRWLVMLLISGLMFATYYFQDFYSGLKDLMENEYGFTSEQFGRIIGLTTIANIFGMIIVGGIILDKWGIRIAGFAFGGLACHGSGGEDSELADFFVGGKEHGGELGLVPQFGYENCGEHRTKQLEIHFRPAFQLSTFIQ